MSKKKPGKQARYKIQRRLGTELPGLGKPGALERRPYPPGENGNKRKKYSDYALRLEEKQKIRQHYCIREEQLRRFIRDAKKGPGGSSWVIKLVNRLERRLDNLVFRLGFASSMKAARQMVSHGHVLVNDQCINISSAVIAEGAVITLKDKAYEGQAYLYAKQNPRLELADYLTKEVKDGKEVGTLIAGPTLDHVPFPFDSGLFTEYYAQRKA